MRGATLLERQMLEVTTVRQAVFWNAQSFGWSPQANATRSAWHAALCGF
jgi:hypothetical protein